MTRILSDELKNQIGQEVLVKGWLHKKRLLGGLTFISIRDRHGLVQIVIENKDEVEKLRGMQVGTVLTVSGLVKDEPRAPGGAELHDASISVDVPVTDEPPIEIDKPLNHKSEYLDTLFEHRVVGLRNLQETAIFKVQAATKEATRKFFASQDFTEFNSPKLLPGATEGGAEVFKLDYFGKEATLAQSAQFYKQIMVGVFERAYEINPTYRAELSNTTRHMTEFIHIDAEMGFIDFNDLLNLLSNLINSVVDAVWEGCGDTYLKQVRAVKPALTADLPRIKLAEVHELYEKATKDKVVDKKDLTPAEERWICEYSAKEFGSEAIFVTDWPAVDMKFYHRASADDAEIAERADLLFRGIEISTASMREHRYDKLVEQLVEKTGASADDPGFKYYLQAFKYGLPPHGGFGMGLERLTQKIIGLNNVKEATLFPRDINRLNP